MANAESYMDVWKRSAFNIYYVLSAISLIIFSVLILKSNFYSKTTGIIGLISGILMVIPSSVGMIGMIFSITSLVPWVIFSLMVVIRLFKI